MVKGDEVPSRAELRAEELQLKREKREAEDKARKEANAAKRASGVIATIHQALSAPQGTTKDEVLAILTEKFPDRDPAGMAVTVQAQLNRLQRRYGKIINQEVEGRGKVYGYEASVKFSPAFVSNDNAAGKGRKRAQAAEPETVEEEVIIRGVIIHAAPKKGK
jgi:hypothetical protein